MKKLTLEYIAGFVDGEGCFTICTRGEDKYSPLFELGNTNLHILQEIQKYFSFNLKIQTLKRKNPKWKTFYILRSNTIDAVKSIAHLLEPHLRIKKEQAQIIMQYPRAQLINIGGRTQQDFSTRAYVLQLRKRIMALNKRGPSTQGADEDLQPEPDPQLNLLELNQKEVS
ncbi:hypothetical protein ES702_06690 [subsurface metagenome]